MNGKTVATPCLRHILARIAIHFEPVRRSWSRLNIQRKTRDSEFGNSKTTRQGPHKFMEYPGLPNILGLRQCVDNLRHGIRRLRAFGD